MSVGSCDDSTVRDSACPKVAVITCAVLENELRHLADSTDHVIQITTIEQRLHDTPEVLRTRLARAVSETDSTTDADVIVLGYGLCSRGIEGVSTRRCRLVIPRAHDCVTLLLGSKERYDAYVRDHPGTYWFSPGWIRHGAMPSQSRYDILRAYYVDQYGQDNAEFLMESELAWLTAYSRGTFVDVGGIDMRERDVNFTRAAADWLGWSFDHQPGDPTLLRDLLTGPWDDERFLVLAPGESAECSADARVIRTVPLRIGGKVIA